MVVFSYAEYANLAVELGTNSEKMSAYRKRLLVKSGHFFFKKKAINIA